MWKVWGDCGWCGVELPKGQGCKNAPHYGSVKLKPHIHDRAKAIKLKAKYKMYTNSKKRKSNKFGARVKY